MKVSALARDYQREFLFYFIFYIWRGVYSSPPSYNNSIFWLSLFRFVLSLFFLFFLFLETFFSFFFFFTALNIRGEFIIITAGFYIIWTLPYNKKEKKKSSSLLVYIIYARCRYHGVSHTGGGGDIVYNFGQLSTPRSVILFYFFVVSPFLFFFEGEGERKVFHRNN
jgi:hypothetical protein